MNELKPLVVVSFIIALYFGILFYLLSLLNTWFLKGSFFGIKYHTLDFRVIPIGFIFSIFGIWLIVEVANYFRMRELRRKNK